jgi:hypothetical protein
MENPYNVESGSNDIDVELDGEDDCNNLFPPVVNITILAKELWKTQRCECLI